MSAGSVAPQSNRAVDFAFRSFRSRCRHRFSRARERSGELAVQLGEYLLTGNYTAASSTRTLTVSGFGSLGDGVVSVPTQTAGTYAIALTTGTEAATSHGGTANQSKIAIVSPDRDGDRHHHADHGNLLRSAEQSDRYLRGANVIRGRRSLGAGLGRRKSDYRPSTRETGPYTTVSMSSISAQWQFRAASTKSRVARSRRRPSKRPSSSSATNRWARHSNPRPGRDRGLEFQVVVHHVDVQRAEAGGVVVAR